MAAASDCELIGSGLLDQPVNALTSLAFVAVAILLWRRPVLAWLAAATGVGSFLYHGTGGSIGVWAHNVTIVWLIVGLAFERWPRLVAVLAIVTGTGLWMWPGVTGVAVLTSALLAAVALAVRRELNSRRGVLAVMIVVAAVAIYSLSRTGGPLCAPQSWLQGHGLWHMLVAGALLVWARSRSGEIQETR